MKIKKLISVGSAMLLSLSSLLAIIPPQAVHAVAYTCTWTGAVSDSFNTAGNWSGCNSAAPQPADGSSLVFDTTNLTSSKTLTNNITNLEVGSITFSGTSLHAYTLIGNGLTINGGIAQSSGRNASVNLDLTLGADQTFSYANANLIIGDVMDPGANTVALGSHALTLSGSTDCYGINISSHLTGSGALVSSATNAVLSVDNPSYTGSITINSGSYFGADTSQALGTAAGGTTVASGATLVFGFNSDTTFAEPLTISGTGVTAAYGAIIASPSAGFGCSGGGFDPTVYTATLSGAITLLANTTVKPFAAHNIVVTGALSGDYTLTVVSGAAGSLTINSSNNTSGSDNGTVTAPKETITVAAGDEDANTYVLVGNNQTYVVDGLRGGTTVTSGGILQGTGTVGNLFVLVGGTAAPGHSPGCLATGNFTIEGTYQAELGGTTACSGYDQLNVTGTVSTNSTTEAILATSLYGTYKPAVGDAFTIVNNDGADAVDGTFKDLPEGATFTVSGYVLKISYVGGDGNDVVLTTLSVPTTPDTGFALLTSHPIATLVATVGAAIGILAINHRFKKVAHRR